VRGSLGEDDIATVLEGADFDPVARADIPAALVSGIHGDGAPLARLLLREGAVTGNRARLASAPVTDSEALFFTTECEETAFPWSRTAPLSDRPGAVAAALAAVPAGVYAPFSRGVEARTGTSRPCMGWPDGSPDSPLVTGPVPDVPVLLLDGAQDTRTPVADAQSVAALFPHASLVAVPWTGHSVIGTDLTDCSQAALTNFSSTGSAGQCSPTPPIVPVSGVAPTSLARLRPARGVTGKRGKTVAAVAATLSDALRQAVELGSLGASIESGGLRGGTLHGALFGSVLRVRVSGLVYVPGVKVSGSLTVDLASAAAPTASVRVAGRAAAAGSLKFRGGRFTGRLGGRPVHSPTAASAATLAARPLSLGTLLRLRRYAALRRAVLGP
jgi:hypothetical protein